jgi:hypothetical protein
MKTRTLKKSPASKQQPPWYQKAPTKKWIWYQKAKGAEWGGM